MTDGEQILVRTELDRVCDRLRTMPLARLPLGAELAFAASGRLVDLAGAHHELPRLADTAAADQLAVVGSELLRSATDEQLRQALAVLTELRRSLP